MFTDLESRVFELGELNSYQTDKIKALRSVALALESENELISKEKGRPMKTQEDHCQIVGFLKFESISSVFTYIYYPVCLLIFRPKILN